MGRCAGRSLAGHFDPEALSRKAAPAFLMRSPNVRSADIYQIELCDRSWPEADVAWDCSVRTDALDPDLPLDSPQIGHSS